VIGVRAGDGEIGFDRVEAVHPAFPAYFVAVLAATFGEGTAMDQLKLVLRRGSSCLKRNDDIRTRLALRNCTTLPKANSEPINALSELAGSW
jgi:hypothetical protein